MPYKNKNKQKEYMKEYSKKRYKLNLESERERNRIKHHKFKDKYNLNSEIYRKNNLDKYSLKAKKYRRKYPEKILAHRLSRKIKFLEGCEICGSSKNLEKHHWDYKKPLLISTLCRVCHNLIHQK